jgi:hypothetical protein
METFVHRAELRRRLLARMGAQTDTTVTAAVVEQLDEYIREAAQFIRDAVEWKRAISELITATQIDERFYSYPLNSGPGDVVRISYWDADKTQYIPLQRRVILPVLENLPGEAFVGDDEIATRGKPVLWEDSSQIDEDGVTTAMLKLNPYPDAEYPLRIDYNGTIIPIDDNTPILVDADCIVTFAFAEMLDAQGDERRAGTQRAKAMARMRSIAGSQRTGQIFRRGAVETARLRFGSRFREPLNFDTSLSRMPPT